MTEIIEQPEQTTPDTDIPVVPEPEMDIKDIPLYAGGTISLGLSLILIMSFTITHNLTDAALQDLLKIISLHCPSPNEVLNSNNFFRNIFSSTIVTQLLVS